MSDKDPKSFHEVMKLSITTLDSDALKQPELVSEWGIWLAEATDERDGIKELLDEAEADADSDIRNSPSSYGWNNALKNPTETWVKYQVEQHPDVVELKSKFRSAQKVVALLTTAQRALDHRMKALQLLTNLHNSGYFAAQSHNYPAYQDAMSRSAERMQEKQIKHLNEKRRNTDDA